MNIESTLKQRWLSVLIVNVINVVSTWYQVEKLKLNWYMLIGVVLALKWGFLFYINIWLSWFHQHFKLSLKLLLVSTQSQRYFIVEFNGDSMLISSRPTSWSYFNIYQCWNNVECFLGCFFSVLSENIGKPLFFSCS